MEINKTILKISASLNYQVASMEVEIVDYNADELEQYTQSLVEYCSNTVKNISKEVGATHTTGAKPVVQTTIQQPTKPVYQKPVYQTSPYQTKTIKPASQKQLDYLRNAFGYVSATPLTFDEADRLLMQFKAQNGLQ